MFRRPLAGITILVVDDHDETREAVAETLKIAGARVLMFNTASPYKSPEALQAAGRPGAMAAWRRG